MIYGVWTRGHLKRGCVTAALFILFLMLVTRLCSLWNSRLNYLWMTENRSFVSNKIYLPSIIMQIKSTIALRTPRYYGLPANADKRQPPGETHKEMTETNSRYYGLLLLQKCGHFPAPKRDISLVFFSRYSGHFSTSSKILTRIT